MKELIYKHYGAFCACCGEDNPKFLCVDHISNNGNHHRKELKKELGYVPNMFRWLKKNNYPPGFQILCYNCNFAKGAYGECPHVTEKKEASLNTN